MATGSTCNIGEAWKAQTDCSRPAARTRRCSAGRSGLPRGGPPDPERITTAALALGRPVTLIDADGYECELIGAAIHVSGHVAFVETRSNDIGPNEFGSNGRHIDIKIRIHLVDQGGRQQSADIESYNPFFGCDVRYFEWLGPTAVLIYREKHSTYACRFGDSWPPRFVEIEDDWVISGDALGFIGYQQNLVRRLSVPELDPLEPIPIPEAKTIGLLPPRGG